MLEEIKLFMVDSLLSGNLCDRFEAITNGLAGNKVINHYSLASLPLSRSLSPSL